MLFTDPFFLFYFLPTILILLRMANYRAGLTNLLRLMIVVITIIFYAYENWLWVFIFLATSVGTYGWAILMNRCRDRRLRKTFLVCAILQCLLTLAAFKYLNWLAGLVPALASLQKLVAAHYGNAAGQVVLPPGISFFTFEAISFLADLYRRRIPLPRNPLNYFAFIAMFPRFIAGPIVRYADVASQFETWSGMRIAQGITIFAIGFIIKVTIADQFAAFVPYAFGTARPDFIQAWTGSLSYTFQLYFDFWGYSIMATGLGMCLGFFFPINFDRPYKSLSITEFWRRWHMSLSFWLRDYLYIPLGGSRGSKVRTYLNLILTMAIGGLWHGAGFAFILWGLYHGVLLAIERAVGQDRMQRLPELLRWSYTFLAIIAGWVLFRAHDYQQAASVYRGMLGLHGFATSFNPTFFHEFGFTGALCVVGVLFWLFGEKRLTVEGGLPALRFSTAVAVGIWILFCFALLTRLSADSIPFLYFQF